MKYRKLFMRKTMKVDGCTLNSVLRKMLDFSGRAEARGALYIKVYENQRDDGYGSYVQELQLCAYK